ncbi:MAG: zinc metallopeptidase [Clostridia bacterium]|nr:zinc metallopeptidase [Clostridia bacterium]
MFELIVVIIAYASIPLFLWMIFASISVRTTYSKYNALPASCGMSAQQAARKILDINGLFDINIGKCSGMLTDHFDPRNNTVYLSQSTINSSSLAAIAVAAHEVGHAIQHAEGYTPIKLRGALVPVVNVVSRMITPFLLLGIIFEVIAVAGTRISVYFYFGALICYVLYALFTFVTLPCEYNASSRAKKQLVECGILTEDEVKTSAKVLSCAARTYLISFFMSLAQVARILLLLLSARNRNNRNR